MNISDAEAEKIVHGYGDVAYLFKRIIEDVFGEKYSYVVQDTEWQVIALLGLSFQRVIVSLMK